MAVSNLKIVRPDLDPSEQQLRAELKQLIERRDAALALRDKAADTNERAVVFISALEANLDDFEDIDARVARERAAAFRAALECNAQPALDVSPELAALSARRMDVQNQLAAARLAQETLAQELAEARATLDRLQADVEHAARNVVGHLANTMARDLAAREEICCALRQCLVGAAAMRPGGQFPLHASTLALLRDDPKNAIQSRNDVRGAHVWNELHAKLLSNSAAKLEE